MIKEGADPGKAQQATWNRKGPWRNAKSEGMHQAYSNKYFEKLGLWPLQPPRRETPEAL